MWYQVVAGLGIGLAGSFHCVGMCGPLALSLPFRGQSFAERLVQIIQYNLGRAATYSLMGLLAGAIGSSTRILGFQKYLSVGLGIGILLFLFLPTLFRRGNIHFRLPGYERVQMAIGKRLQSAPVWYSFFGIGMLNGLLPCGLVYLGLAAAMATGTMLSGAGLMFFFGLGTFPLMMAFLAFGQSIPLPWRMRMRKAVPVFVFLTAVLMIWRGYSVQEPSSPKDPVPRTACHKIR